jgi:hypothetical protein
MATADDYEDLPKEEREARDKADRARELAEQAGTGQLSLIFFNRLNVAYVALPYTWRQELGEVDVTIPVPKGTRAKDLFVILQKKRLSVSLKGQDKILDGELCKGIKVEDSTWTLRACFVSIGLHSGSSPPSL